MEPKFDIRGVFDKYNRNAQHNVASVLSVVPVWRAAMTLPPRMRVDLHHGASRLYYRVLEGNLELCSDGDPILSYQRGDLAGVHESTLPFLEIIAGDSPVIVDVYREGDLLDALAANELAQAAWHEYICRTVSLLLKVVGAYGAQEPTAGPHMKLFRPGEAIIEQGAPSRGVYTLVEGGADVFVDGVMVGDVNANEIFGAIAAITNAPRSASVIARTHCLVMEVDKDDFKSMLQTHPALVTKLIEDMARTIQELNTQVVGLSLLK